jgi:hypothetical protein
MVMRRGAVVALVFLTASALAAKQPVERVRSGAASVAGRITEADTKRPLGGVLVTLIAQDLRARLSTVTTPDGRYVFEGIAPAPYVVEASHPDYVPARFVEADPQRAKTQYLWVTPSSPHRTDVDLDLVPAGTINGRITDQQGRPLQGAMVTLMRDVGERNFRMTGLQSVTLSDAAGGYSLRQVAEGSYRISVNWNDPEALKAKSSVRDRPSYHPGTNNPLEAAIIRVARGETVNNIDVIFTRADTASISGHVLRLLSEGPLEMYLVAGASSTRALHVADDGAFSATHLQPGRYTLWARAKTSDGSEAAMAHVDVGSSNVSGVILALAPTSRVRGRVVIEDVGHPPLTSMQVAAVIADDDDRVDPLERDRAPIGSDGSFELSDIFGERVFHVIAAEPNWIIDRVMHGSAEVPAIVVPPSAEVSDIVIVLRRR